MNNHMKSNLKNWKGIHYEHRDIHFSFLCYLFNFSQLIAEEKEFLAHKIILAASSPYFEAMFTHGFKEEEVIESADGIPIIVLHSVSSSGRFRVHVYIFKYQWFFLLVEFSK